MTFIMSVIRFHFWKFCLRMHNENMTHSLLSHCELFDRLLFSQMASIILNTGLIISCFTSSIPFKKLKMEAACSVMLRLAFINLNACFACWFFEFWKKFIARSILSRVILISSHSNRDKKLRVDGRINSSPSDWYVPPFCSRSLSAHKMYEANVRLLLVAGRARQAVLAAANWLRARVVFRAHSCLQYAFRVTSFAI